MPYRQYRPRTTGLGWHQLADALGALAEAQGKIAEQWRKAELGWYIASGLFLLSAACNITVIVCHLLGVE